MIQKNEQIFSITDLSLIVKKIISDFQGIQIVTLQGTLGAGKTTFAIELLRQLGVTKEMQSPTYTYLQVYKNMQGKNFYHFDLYRLKNKEDFLFAGFDDFLYQPNSLVIIEWPEIIESLLDRNVCSIELKYELLDCRRIVWSYK